MSHPFGLNRIRRLALLAAVVQLLGITGPDSAVAELKVERALEIVPVWSGHPVRFALLTHGDSQYVAFYDADRQMTVASRRLGTDSWRLARLPSRVGWDSHNYIAMVVDDEGLIHVSGNMHCVPLIYFRTKRPGDVASFERIPAMVGRNERRCTYPRFLRGSKNELIFTYRDGSSGNGDQIWNVYDHSTHAWRRLLDRPLFSGEGKMNAYFVGPAQDAKGMFHVCWVWRDTPDCATNHHLCYARSKDLVNWQTSDGRPLRLPITLGAAEVIDPVPPGGGMLNGNTKIGFDSKGRPVVGYHKFDADGKTQLFNARRESTGWKIHQTSDWDYRWEFHGGGTIRAEVGLGPVCLAPDGTLTQTYRNAKHGSANWRLDEATLLPIGKAPRPDRLPSEVSRVRSDRPGMKTRIAHDQGQSGRPEVRYVLRWETLPRNRDRAHPGDPPQPSILTVFKLRGGR